MTIKIKQAAGRQIYVHGRPRVFQTPKGTVWHIPHSKEAFEAIDYVWPNLGFCVGSSGVAGALWARHGMGFDEVIMAGIPLSHKALQYVEGYPNKYSQSNGYAVQAQIENWLSILKSHVQNGRTDGIYSMSGATQRILGAPSEIENGLKCLA
jgi:hypothetical protein